MGEIDVSIFPEIDPRFPMPVALGGEPYPTAENAFQASKFRSPYRRARIARTDAARAACQCAASKPDAPGWDPVSAMRRIQESKFSSPAMQKALQETGSSPIVFTNLRHDNYWGTCRCARCRGKGRNLLGVLLQELRDSVQEQASIS